ncbi:MAG: MarR family transcriptional regulator [Pedobacter sp.]|nr:MAG: MarR family transcriptional regulator [Pedobacter sp.]
MSSITITIAKQTYRTIFKNRATFALTMLLGLALGLATYVGWENFKTQNNQRIHYKEMVRQQWLAKPDKHPHRMAHYGYLAFREKHELSFFDFGIESFAGVSIFLEAHKQNTLNFSEAGFSNGMLRFGEISVAMVLQLLVPLLIFFLGYNSISEERETGTLKILLCQNVSWKKLMWGKTLGIIGVCLSIFIPLILLTILLWASLSEWKISADSALRLMVLVVCYAIYFFIIAALTVLVSAFNRSSRNALTTLLACWILFMVIMPRITQAIGYVLINIEKDGTAVSKLAGLLGVKATSLSRMLNNMEELGLIYRETSSGDKRSVKVYLTDFGVEKRQLAKGVVISFNEYLNDNLSVQERSNLISTLQKLNKLTLAYTNTIHDEQKNK